MSEKIVEQTPQEQLTIFRNGHLKDFIAACIRLEQAKQSNLDEIVGFREHPGPGGSVVRIDMNAKDMIKQEEKTVKIQARFLIAIERVAEQFKKNPTLWHQEK